MENITLLDIVELVANLVTIFGILLAIYTYFRKIYNDYRPIKNAHFIYEGKSFEELSKNPDYLCYGRDLYFKFYIDISNEKDVIIDKIALSVQHGITNDHFLFHQPPSKAFHFSVNNDDCDAFFDKSIYLEKEFMEVRNFALLDKVFIEKITKINTAVKILKRRKERYKKFISEVDLYTASPVIYIEITSREAKSKYFIYSFIREEITS